MKNILLTGATSGIGEAAAMKFAELGYNLFLTARNPAKAEEVDAKIRSSSPAAQIHWLMGNFAKLEDVRKIANDFIGLGEPLDLLFSNAGLATGKRELSHDGFEMMFAVNHLAPFLLTNLLLEKLCEGEGEARVVLTASAAYKFVNELNVDDLQWQSKFKPMQAYGHSKLANILFTQSLAQKLPERAPRKSMAINCFHPGFVGTGLASDTRTGKIVMGLFRPFIRSGMKGAETGIYLATDPEVHGRMGGYYMDCKQQKLKPHARDMKKAEALWQASAELCGL